ncbi:MAG TPA: cytochrome C [Proteobacteria bacterium]|nr:basic cytochrome c3 precursor [bacterium BMS3Abin14]HDL53200.1 cytochrome C [Pseudomonadota bacterium]
MRRKMLVFALAFIVAAAFSVPLLFAGTAPTQIVIDHVAKKKPGVPFDHAEHAGTIDCQKCHHKDVKGAEKDCFDCHGVDPKANNFDKFSTNPFHILCRGCHSEMKQETPPKQTGPTRCSGCHKKG